MLYKVIKWDIVGVPVSDYIIGYILIIMEKYVSQNVKKTEQWNTGSPNLEILELMKVHLLQDATFD